MASAGTPVSKRRRSDTSSCSPLSVTARRLLVAKCARGGTLVAHSSSWKSEICETVAARYSGLRLEESNFYRDLPPLLSAIALFKHVEDKGARRTPA